MTKWWKFVLLRREVFSRRANTITKIKYGKQLKPVTALLNMLSKFGL